MADRLDVYWDKALVGKFWLDGKRSFVFQYDPGWLAEGSRKIPLSVRLPLREAPFSGETPKIFFSNLLPEGRVREMIAKIHRVSEKNDFKLLEILGGECAGAISLVPEGAKPDSGGIYDSLSWAELDVAIDRLPRNPLLMAKGELRLSLAGAQHKLPVFVRNNRLFFPKGSCASSHILKPQIPGFENTVENEAFCMALAGACELPVPPVDICKESKHAVLLVKRYDRLGDRFGVRERLHQEDFCQALGFSYEQKYQSEGGPSLKDCFTLLEERSFRPMVDKKNLLRWTIFNYLIGNGDAHAKNISLLITQEGFQLAPFYDLLSTAVYSNLKNELAMKIGGESRPDWIVKRHWQRLADDANVSAKIVFGYAREMGEELPAMAQKLAKKFIPEHGAQTIIDQISRYIVSTSRKLLEALRHPGEIGGHQAEIRDRRA